MPTERWIVNYLLAEVDAGRMTPEQAKAEVRTWAATLTQIRSL
jgi:hypothetical protein